MNARLIKVIETDFGFGRGTGPRDAYRNVRQYWTTDGELLATVDPCSKPLTGNIGEFVRNAIIARGMTVEGDLQRCIRFLELWDDGKNPALGHTDPSTLKGD